MVYQGPWFTRGRGLPGAVRTRAASAVLGEVLDLGTDVGQVDGGRDERGDRQDRGRAHAVHRPGQSDHGGHAEDDEPQLLGLFACRHEGLALPGDGIDEGPRLDEERREAESQEKVPERGIGTKHGDHAT